MTPRPPEWLTGRRFGVVALAAVPWTVLVYPEGVDLVFAWGLVSWPPHVTSVWTYAVQYSGGFGGLPRHLQAWPLSAGLYALAVCSTALARWGREDRRVTAGLLGLAAANQAVFALGAARPAGITAAPVGVVVVLAVAAWTLLA